MADDARLIGQDIVPPDVQVAAGPNHIVEMVNLLMGVWTKDGVSIANVTLASFFGSGSHFISDPKIQFDAASGRWFASVTDATAGTVLVAVSTSSDPTGSWHQFTFSGTGLLDQPILGVGSSTVILSVNVFSSIRGGYLGAQYWVVNKTDLLRGAVSPAFFLSPLNPNDFSLHPVQVLGPSVAHYLVATYWPGTQTWSNTLQLITVTGTPPGLVTIAEKDLSMSRADVPPSADQLGSNGKIDSGDIRVSDAVYTAGKIWLGFDEACRPSGDSTNRACVRLMELDAAAGSILQSLEVAVSGKHVFYPALRTDSLGNLAVLVGYSSASEYPGILATGRVYGDAPGVLQSLRTVVAGTGPEDPPRLCSSLCRYGDYFGAGLDPTDSTTIWLAGQFGTSSGWSTRILGTRIKAVLTFSYAIQGGGAGAGTPSLAYVFNGTSSVTPLTSLPATYLADPGSAWTVSADLAGSTTTERWSARGANDIPPLPGLANASLTETFTYYHQYNVTFSTTVFGGGSPASRQVAVTAMGLQAWVASNQDYWVDAGSSYTFENPLGGSSGSERWYAVQGLAGTVDGPGSVFVQYFHQYAVTFNYDVLGGTGYGAPTIAVSQFAADGTVAPSVASWADAGGSYAYSPSLPGSTATMRWAAGANGAGTITAPSTIIVHYRVQYYVGVVANPAGAVSLLQGGGWYDVGATAMLSAATDANYLFQGWSGTGAGSYTGSASSASVTVNEPIAEIATFLPGLTIAAGSGGSVSYSYGSVSGTVPAGGSTTIYVPPGTGVTLTASPSSWTDAFSGWLGGPGGSNPTTLVTVQGPLTVTASFTPTPLLFLVVLVAAIVAVLAILISVRRKRQRTPPA